jgi:hypothetical protein
METKFIFVFLRIILFIVLLATGYAIFQKRKNNSATYWKNSMIALIAYSLIEGLRYMRGTDYILYKEWYEGLEKRELEPAFDLLNSVLNFMGMPYTVAFFVYSFLTIFCAFVLLKQHKEIAFFAVPLVFLATIVQSENLIRQILAFSIILYSMTYLNNNSLNNNNWLKFGVIFLVAALTHYSSIILLPFIILFRYLNRPLANIYILCFIYLLTFLWKPEYWGNYYVYFNFLQDNNVYATYAENMEHWLSVGDYMGISSLFYKIRLGIFNLGIIILGYRLALKYKQNNFNLYYNLFIIGAIFQNITTRIEILYRLDLYFYMFWFIVLAFICYDTFVNNSDKKIIRIICICLLFNSLYDYLIADFFNLNDINKMQFIWDK